MQSAAVDSKIEAHAEELLDEALEETFPASDVPSVFQATPVARAANSRSGAATRGLMAPSGIGAKGRKESKRKSIAKPDILDK